MQQRAYGRSGVQTSAIGLGGAFLTARSFAEGVATVRRALDLGITYFDTSPMYCQGASQAVLGEALDGLEGGFLLATKLGYFAHPAHYHAREALLAQFNENLRLLRRRRVDVLQLHEADFHHWWSPDSSYKGRIQAERDYDFDAATALHVLRALQTDERCRFVGISGNSAPDMERVLRHARVDTFLLAFNYDLLRRAARPVLARAEVKGVARMVGAIFQRGLARPQPELLEKPPEWMSRELLERFRTLYALQKQSGLSLAALGVRYMVAQPGIDVVIIGAAAPGEIEECARAAEEGPLPADLRAEIEALGTE